MVDTNATDCDIDELRGLFLFEGLTDDQLTRLCREGRVLTLPAGELCREGEPADYFYVLLDGEIALSVRSGTRDISIWRASQPGSYCGAWSAFLLEDEVTYENSAALTRPSRVFELDATTLGKFLRTEFPMSTHLLVGHSRGRSHARRIVDPHDRLVQLGQLTAGLTHELNNPAAAAVRAASELRIRVARLRHRRADLWNGTFTLDAAACLVELQDRASEIAVEPRHRTAVKTSDLEETLGDWLEEHRVEEAWEHAATLAEAGIGVDWLEEISASPCGATPTTLSAAISWLSTTVETELLLTEITDATQRISTLIHQAKQYSQLDRAPFDLADVKELINSTLTMLSHRLGSGVTVVRDFDPGLPALPCYPAELNQVWTNLINNALDAMGGLSHGVLTVRTRRDQDVVRVEVCDNGAGIPDELLPRIFDPFFTTKPFGEGTGLGLDISARIIDRHGGSLWAESVPRETRFIATLPLTAPA